MLETNAVSKPQLTILHVDDNEANRYVVARTLQNAGFNVVEAATGTAALTAIAQYQPALVILDVELPDMNGFEVCRQVKANPETVSIPVLHLSASFVQSQDKAEGLDSGADAYLIQPVEPIELLATVRALLRIRRAEEAALASAREWQTTFDSINDGVCLVDQDGKFLRCNDAMSRLLCQPTSKILGCAHAEVLKAALGVGDGTCFRLTKATHQRQVLELHANGRWFSKTVDPVLDEQGTFTGAALTLADITDRKEAEAVLQAQTKELGQLNKQLIQATGLVSQRNEELNQFAYAVSNDLKAPLRSITNLSTWIEEDVGNQVPPDTKRNLNLLRSRTSRMERLIDGLLAYAQIGYQAELNEQFSLHELLLEIVDLLEIPPQFTVQIPPDLPTITTSRLLLSQVFSNLISNAVEHHNRLDGQVQITAQVKERGYEFTVTDDGSGIASNNHSRVFDIFQTLTSRDKKESAGIGLAIIKKIIQQVGGQIYLESELGQGASFIFTWPLSEPDANR